MADGLLNKASIILTPTGYKAGTLYNVAPIDEPYEDFDFARASVASRVNSSGLVEMVGRTLGSELVQNGDFSELGSELVPSIIAIENNNGGVINYISGNTYSSTSDGTSTSLIRPKFDFNTTNGKTYKLVITPTGAITGTVKFGFYDGSSYLFQNYDFTTTKEIYFTDNGTVFAAFDGQQTYSIDSFTISIKQVDPNDRWSLGGAATIENDALHLESATNEYSYARQDISSLAAKTYKIQLQIKNYVSGSCEVGFSGASSNFENLNVTSDGTYTAYVSPNTNGDDLEISREFGGGNFNFDVDNVSVKEIIDTNNIPRISYDSNGDNGHILLEPTSTNLITYSEDFSQSSWINTYTLTPNSIISPDGSLNAYTITLPSVNGNLRTNVSVSSSTDYIFSFYAKRGTASEMKYRVFDFTNLSDIVSKTSYYSQTDINNWVRIEVPFTTNATTSEVGVYIDSDSQGNGDFYAWGAQVEELPYATSYIPTLTGSQETRATETATGAGSADLINSTEGVLYAEIESLANDTTNRYITLTNGTSNERVALLLSANNNQLRAIIFSASQSINISFSTTVTSSLQFNKLAVRYKSGEYAFYLNGSSIGTDTNSNIFTSNTLNDLSLNVGGGSLPFYGKCKALAVFKEALSDSELTQLTT